MGHHVTGACLPSQSASEMHNQEKSPQTFTRLVNFSKNMSAMFDNHFNKLFTCSRCVTCVSCSVHLISMSRCATCAKDYGLFLNLNYPQISEIGKSEVIEKLRNYSRVAYFLLCYPTLLSRSCRGQDGTVRGKIPKHGLLTKNERTKLNLWRREENWRTGCLLNCPYH